MNPAARWLDPAARWLDPAVDLEERVLSLVDDLASEESHRVALGDFEPLTRRGVPAPHYVDAGTGLRDVPGATAFPAGIALAAGFDAELAEEYGRAVGTEARAAGFTVVLGPTLDLARDPRGGRIPEALGEDPYLSGMIGAAHVRGAQSVHVITQLKHFVAYNGEDRRTGEGLEPARGPAVDVRVSRDVLQDTYLRPFRAAVEACAWSIMGSYNRLSGSYVCESADLLRIPREQWGWGGFYCPDFLFAVRDDAAALAAGLDLPALGGPGGRTPEMVEGAGDDAVRALVGNVVRALIGSGLVDDPPSEPALPSSPGHRDLAQRAAVASMVLLANTDAALPLGQDVRRIAVIGPSGDDALFVVGGSAAVSLDPDRVITPLAGILARAGDRVVEVAQGSVGDLPLPPVPATAFTLPDGSGPGIEVEFTAPDGRRWREVVAQVDHACDPADPASRWPARWRCLLTSAATGPHRLSLSLGGRATLRLDGRTVLVGSREAEQFLHGPHYPLQAVVDLVAGRPVALDLEFAPGSALSIPPLGVGPVVRLGWQPPSGMLADAVAAAARVDAAVVLVNQASGEGMDRDSLALPGDQDELIRRVAAVNSRTIVVLNTPGAVLVPWLDDVAAVLQAWYPGERFGAALAAVLFGDAEPGGRLPLTFPRSREHLPGGDHGPETVAVALDYDADGGIGYRSPGVARHGAAVPFGFGLGYARCRHDVTAVEATDDGLLVHLRVSNDGDRDTVHVVQAYATVADDGPELVAVARVRVAAGLTVDTELVVPADGFARWQQHAGKRLPVEGSHTLRIADHSADPGTQLSLTCQGGRLKIA